MKIRALSLFLTAVMLFFSCSDDNEVTIDTNSEQQATILAALNDYVNDTTTLSPEDRLFYEELREIDNDIDVLYTGLNPNLSYFEMYNIIKANFRSKLDLITQMASEHYNQHPSWILLAQNAYVLMSYDALERHSPEFLWTKLGVFAANEVRNGLVLANVFKRTLEQNNIHIIMDFSTGDEATDILFKATEILMEGQRNVFVDIGSLSILNKFGAEEIAQETWLTDDAVRGFTIQHQAELSKASGNTLAYFDLQTEAAIEFGAHEQIHILQSVWDEPLMRKMNNLNNWLMDLSDGEFVFFGDIFIGVNKYIELDEGYVVKIPSNATNLVNANHRVEIARNGFNTLNDLRKDEDWSYWVNYSQLRIGKFIDVYLPNVDL